MEETVLLLTEESRDEAGQSANEEYVATNMKETEDIESEGHTHTPSKAVLSKSEAGPGSTGNGVHGASVTDSLPPSHTTDQQASNELSKETEERLTAAAKERDELRLEVIELRRSLENIQQQHEDKLAGLRSQVDDAESGKEHAEVQYKTLLGKVNTIRAQLGERLKADAVCSRTLAFRGLVTDDRF